MKVSGEEDKGGIRVMVVYSYIHSQLELLTSVCMCLSERYPKSTIPMFPILPRPAPFYRLLSPCLFLRSVRTPTTVPTGVSATRREVRSLAIRRVRVRSVRVVVVLFSTAVRIPAIPF